MPDQPSTRRTTVWAASILVLLSLLFFRKIVFTDLIFPRGDVFTYFYPYWAYRNATLSSGHIPLWNPYLFMGVPFLANSQVGVLYPLNWPLIWMDAPNAVKAAIAGHIIIAALGMFVFTQRTLRLSELPAMLASVVFALGGYLTSQVEHVNQLQGLAWLPWIFWLWDGAREGKRKYIVLLGAAFAMQLLAGHTQTVFITGIGLGVWAVWNSDLRLRRLSLSAERTLLWNLGIIAVAALLAIGLSAGQLFPTFELAQLSPRSGGLPPLDAVSFSLPPTLLGRSLLPNYADEGLFSEFVAYIGIAALTLAVGSVLRRTRSRQTNALIILAGLGLFLALGGYNPIYWLLVRFVPGFDLFRAPARWLALWNFAMAGLTGLGADSLTDERSSVRPWLPLALAIPLAALTLTSRLGDIDFPGIEEAGSLDALGWIIATLLTSGILIVHQREFITRKQAVWLLAGLIVAELFAASHTLAFSNLTTPQAWASQRPALSTQLAAKTDQQAPDRFLSMSDIVFDPGDLRELEVAWGPSLTDEGFYDYIIATKQKEIIAPNLPLAWGLYSVDGFDGGILPTRDYLRLTSFMLDTENVPPDGRLREYLDTVPDSYWLRLTNTGWVITDKVYDLWFEGIYYDLQVAAVSQAAGEARPIIASAPDSFDATAVGIVGHTEDTEKVGNGEIIATLTAYSDDHVIAELPIRFGQDIGSGTSPASGTVVAGYFTPLDPELAETHGLLSWGEAASVTHIIIEADPAFSGEIVIRGITLIDERSGAFTSMTIGGNDGLHIANSGDVKTYRYDATWPRAYVACYPLIANNTEDMWQMLEEGQRSDTPVIADQDGSRADCVSGNASVRSYAPERVEIDAEIVGGDGYLILSDADYPGWTVSVDGESETLLRANGIFRAVHLPQGNHNVVFAYQSSPFRMGAIVSIASWVLAFGALLMPWKRLSQRQRSPEES